MPKQSEVAVTRGRHGFYAVPREWARRLGASLPMRMTASWSGSAWDLPNTSVWRGVARPMASSPRMTTATVRKAPSPVHRPSACSGVKTLQNTSCARAAKPPNSLAFRALDGSSRIQSGSKPNAPRGTACPRSSRPSTARCAAGLNTSSTVAARHSLRSTAGSGGGCAISCENSTGARGSRAATTISSGPMPTLPSMGFSACETPMSNYASPLAGKTIDWRAGCGRSARPVRREGGSKPIGSPYPYQRQVTEIP